MKDLTHLVMHKTNTYPTGLKSADEVAGYVGNISAARILELADSGYLPHYRIDGGTPQFKPAEVKGWLANNLMARCEGRALPDAIRIVIPAPDVTDDPPNSISNVPYLQQLPKYGYQPGVYFLCKGAEVVYVGQSVTPSSRVGAHTNDRQKDFDRVYLLPVPKSELDNVEAAFIHHLRPAQQGGIKSGRSTPVSPGMTRPMGEILNSVLTQQAGISP